MDDQDYIFSLADLQITAHDYEIATAAVDPVAPVLACLKCFKRKDAIEEPVVTFCGHLFCWHCLFEEVPPDHDVTEGISMCCPTCEIGMGANSPYKDQNSIIPVYKKISTLEKNVSHCLVPRPSAIGFSVSDLNEKTELSKKAVLRFMKCKSTFISISEQNKSVVDSVEERFKKIRGRFIQKN